MTITTKAGSSKFAETLLAELNSIRQQSQQTQLGTSSAGEGGSGGKSFLDHLKEGVQDVNQAQKVADKMAVDVSTGRSPNLHETMLAATKAELSFNLLVQVRNKALEAYQEIMRMQV